MVSFSDMRYKIFFFFQNLINTLVDRIFGADCAMLDLATFSPARSRRGLGSRGNQTFLAFLRGQPFSSPARWGTKPLEERCARHAANVNRGEGKQATPQLHGAHARAHTHAQPERSCHNNDVRGGKKNVHSKIQILFTSNYEIFWTTCMNSGNVISNICQVHVWINPQDGQLLRKYFVLSLTNQIRGNNCL